MEIFKFILTNYGPAVASVVVMIYLCFFTKKSINGNEQKLKDDLSMVIRENAELKVQLKENIKTAKETLKKLEEKVDDLEGQLENLIGESGLDERDNKEFKD